MIGKPRQTDLQRLREENARLRKSIDDLLNINQLAQVISSTMPVEQILDKVLGFSLKAIQAEQGTVSLLSRNAGQDPFKTLIRKVDASGVRDKYRLDEDLSGWMIKHRKPLMINDFRKDTTFRGHAGKLMDIRSLLSVPLLCKGRLIGVLNLFNKKNEGRFTEDDQRLLSIIGSQSAQVIENARLYEEEKHLREIERELETARSIQLELLPKQPPRIPGFDIAGASYPAKEVGGDYFDFIPLSQEKWGIALGDISGKGVPAALLMSNMQATLRSQAVTNPDVVSCIEKTNHILFLNTDSNKFVTLFYGELDAAARRFRYVNAGHNFPFLLEPSGEIRTLQRGGLILGMLPDCRYEDETLMLTPGSTLVIFSDGVTEAENEQGALFGEQRLKELIRHNRAEQAEEMVARIYQAVQTFTGANEQEDDVTVVVLKSL